jgi:hypothetical protein
MMKRLLTLLLLALVVAGALGAENVPYASLTPKTATSMAMGGVFSSIPTAEFSFFGNPAGFASQKSTLMLPELDAWLYLKPTSSNLSRLAKSLGDKNALLTQVFNLMADNHGSGGGASLGLGYAGKGIGAGFFASSDEFVEGSNPASSLLHSETELSAVIGLGLPIQLGALRMSVGGDLRPFYRISLQQQALADLLANNNLASLSANAFFGVAMDLGASMQLGSFTLGLSVRDIAPTYLISTDTLSNIASSLGSGSLPKAAPNADAAVFSPNVTAGLSWAPKLVPGLVEPALYLELQDPVNVARTWDGIGSALKLLHVGAEVKLLNFIYLRGGLNRGWISAGAGLKFLFLDLNAAVFTEELGPLPGDQPRSGLALQAAFRF